jgi:hypothetical protein
LLITKKSRQAAWNLHDRPLPDEPGKPALCLGSFFDVPQLLHFSKESAQIQRQSQDLAVSPHLYICKFDGSAYVIPFRMRQYLFQAFGIAVAGFYRY